MKIGIIREGKVPVDRRVPFNPEQCNLIEARYPQVELLVQSSEHRAFSDDEYAIEGLKITDSLAEAEVIFGVKEVPIDDLIPDKTYFFFSHTIKKQAYNRDLLRSVIEKNIRLIDYECLTNKKGMRLLGFGRYAGIVGAYNAFLTYGKRSGQYELKPAHQCKDQKEMEAELKKVSLPANFKIAMSGFGRVASGAREILEQLKLQEVSPADFLNEPALQPQFTQLSVEEYFKKSDGSDFKRTEVFKHPERFENNFFPYAAKAQMYIACHYWDDRGPKILTAEQLADPELSLEVIADISCDIDDPIASTIRPSTIDDPIYEVNKKSREEVSEKSEDTLSVMAVDNLPCELPREASTDFGEALLEHVLPNLLGSDSDAVIERANIAADGQLKPDYTYLQDFLEGKE